MSMGVSLGMDRNVLHAIHRLRAVEGITQDAVAVKADLEEVQDMLEAGLDYTEVSKQQNYRLKKYHFYMWLAMVKRLVRRKDLSPRLLNILKQHTTLRSFYAQYESMPDHSLETMNGCCKLRC